MAEKPKKLSDLDQIENISGDDLFLVSDFDGGACISKKMTMSQVVGYICAAIARDPSVAETIRQAVEQAVSTDLEPVIMQTVEKNIDSIADLIADGELDETMTIDGNNG